jgi:hypothetical protein
LYACIVLATLEATRIIALINTKTSFIIKFIAGRAFVTNVIKDTKITPLDLTGNILCRKNAQSFNKNILFRTNLTTGIQVRCKKAVRKRRMIRSTLINCTNENCITIFALPTCIIIYTVYTEFNIANILRLSNINNATPIYFDKSLLASDAAKLKIRSSINHFSIL